MVVVKENRYTMFNLMTFQKIFINYADCWLMEVCLQEDNMKGKSTSVLLILCQLLGS